MGQYLLKRLALTVVVVLLVMTGLSLLTQIVPGDPARAILGARADPAMVELVRKEMRLDDPVYVQVGAFIWGAVRGDLGNDFLSGVPVTSFISAALPHTLALAAMALLIVIFVGVPAGVYTATHPKSWLSMVVSAFSISLISIPSYVAGLVLLILFAINHRFLPAGGTGEFSHPVDYLRHLILPAGSLAAAWTGYIARLVRASMLEVLGTEYVKTANAYGLRDRLIHYKYALRNAVVPIVALFGVSLGSMMGGAVFIELIFNRPGLGTTIFQAIQVRNFTVVRAGVLVLALFFVFANLLADLVLRYLDPRIGTEL